ncbi:hypothetical protein ADUPG1_009178, partial [Aduncisulcus paluster]
ERQRIDDEEKELKFLKEFQPQRDSSDSTSDHDDIVTDDATKAFSNSSSSSIPTSASLSSRRQEPCNRFLPLLFLSPLLVL